MAELAATFSAQITNLSGAPGKLVICALKVAANSAIEGVAYHHDDCAYVR